MEKVDVIKDKYENKHQLHLRENRNIHIKEVQDYRVNNLQKRTIEMMDRFMEQVTEDEQSEQDNHNNNDKNNKDPNHHQNNKKKKLTKVQGFNLTKKRDKESIMDMKLRIDMENKEQEINKHLNQKFKANQVPKHVSDKLFDEINERTRIKRKEKKKEEKKKKKKEKGLEGTDFDEPYRTQRIRQNAVKLYNEAQDQQFRKLYEEGLDMIDRRENAWKIQEQRKHIPDINMVPDFKGLQKKFQDQLDRVKEDIGVTQVVEFDMSGQRVQTQICKKIQIMGYLNQNQQIEPRKRDERYKKILENNKHVSYQTRNQELYKEHRDKVQQKKQKEQMKRDEEDYYRQMKYERMKDVVQSSKYIKDDKQTSTRVRTEKSKDQNKHDYQQIMDQINHRVSQRPLLFEYDKTDYQVRMEQYQIVLDKLKGYKDDYQVSMRLNQKERQIYEQYLYESHNGTKDIFKMLNRRKKK